MYRRHELVSASSVLQQWQLCWIAGTTASGATLVLPTIPQFAQHGAPSPSRVSAAHPYIQQHQQ
jgi:hypothetical protein